MMHSTLTQTNEKKVQASNRCCSCALLISSANAHGRKLILHRFSNPAEWNPCYFAYASQGVTLCLSLWPKELLLLRLDCDWGEGLCQKDTFWSLEGQLDNPLKYRGGCVCDHEVRLRWDVKPTYKIIFHLQVKIMIFRKWRWKCCSFAKMPLRRWANHGHKFNTVIFI